jgi:hypothetical protein
MESPIHLETLIDDFRQHIPADDRFEAEFGNQMIHSAWQRTRSLAFEVAAYNDSWNIAYTAEAPLEEKNPLPEPFCQMSATLRAVASSPHDPHKHVVDQERHTRIFHRALRSWSLFHSPQRSASQAL